MIPIKRIGKMRINNRKREEFCSLFECPVCCCSCFSQINFGLSFLLLVLLTS